MQYHVFYCFYANPELGEVPSEAPLRMDLTQICQTLLPNLKEPGDFVGLVDANAVTLQTCKEEGENEYWVEIPMPEKKGSYGKHCSLAEMLEIFKNAPEQFTLAAFAQFHFEPWDVSTQIVE